MARRAVNSTTCGGSAARAAIVATALAIWGCLLPAAQAQRLVHPRHSLDMVPGAVGRDQLTRGGALAGYFQPVRIVGPPGSQIAMVLDGAFEQPQPSPVTVGLLIGQVYRLQVTRIPGNPGAEVYPTIEVVNRLYPPRGEKARFAVPVHLTQEELEMAISGRFVTRVIYLENPATALPRPEQPGFQRYFDVRADQDPLQVADQLGRPMAILRIGSRLPDRRPPSSQFTYGSPPLVKYPPAEQKPAVGELKGVTPNGTKPSDRRRGQPPPATNGTDSSAAGPAPATSRPTSSPTVAHARPGTTPAAEPDTTPLDRFIHFSELQAVEQSADR